MWSPLKAWDDLHQTFVEDDFPAALDRQVATPKGQCVAARNDDHKTISALKT